MAVSGMWVGVDEVRKPDYYQVSMESPLYKGVEFIEFSSNLFKSEDKYEGLEHFVDEMRGEFSAEPFFTIEMAKEFEEYFNEKFILFTKNKHLKIVEGFTKYFTNCPHCKTEQEVTKQLKVTCNKCDYVYKVSLPES